MWKLILGESQFLHLQDESNNSITGYYMNKIGKPFNSFTWLQAVITIMNASCSYYCNNY